MLGALPDAQAGLSNRTFNGALASRRTDRPWHLSLHSDGTNAKIRSARAAPLGHHARIDRSGIGGQSRVFT